MPTRSKAKQFRFPTPHSDDASISSEVAAANSYIEKIRAAYAKSAEGILETGRALVEAKANLSDSTFSTLVETKLPFSRQWAYKLMAIAESNRLASVKDTLQLPPRVETLYAMTRLDDESWKRAKDRGLIRQDVTQAEIVAAKTTRAEKVMERKARLARGLPSPAQCDPAGARRTLDTHFSPLLDSLFSREPQGDASADLPWWTDPRPIPHWVWEDERERNEVVLHLGAVICRAPDGAALDAIESVLTLAIETCRESRRLLDAARSDGEDYRRPGSLLREAATV